MQVKRENTNKALAIIIIVFTITATTSLHFPSSTTSSIILIKWTECYETQYLMSPLKTLPLCLVQFIMKCLVLIAYMCKYILLP